MKWPGDLVKVKWSPGEISLTGGEDYLVPFDAKNQPQQEESKQSTPIQPQEQKKETTNTPIHPQEQLKEDTNDSLIVGKWNWNHDGKNSNNAFIILHPDGKCTCEGGD